MHRRHVKPTARIVFGSNLDSRSVNSARDKVATSPDEVMLSEGWLGLGFFRNSRIFFIIPKTWLFKYNIRFKVHQPVGIYDFYFAFLTIFRVFFWFYLFGEVFFLFLMYVRNTFLIRFSSAFIWIIYIYRNFITKQYSF